MATQLSGFFEYENLPHVELTNSTPVNIADGLAAGLYGALINVDSTDDMLYARRTNAPTDDNDFQRVCAGYWFYFRAGMPVWAKPLGTAIVVAHIARVGD